MTITRFPKRLPELNRVRFRLRAVMQTLPHHVDVFTQPARNHWLKLDRVAANSQWVLALLRACSG